MTRPYGDGRLPCMVSDTPCRVTGNHDWVYGCQSMWCAKCWLVKVYPPPALTPHQRNVKATAKVGKPGKPNGRAWKEAESQPECWYCDERFTEQNPPTLDHIIPVSQGGTLRDGWVLSCSLCNGARGCSDYEAYVEAVELARIMAIHDDSGFRRPKAVMLPDGTWTITLATRRERKAAKAETA